MQMIFLGKSSDGGESPTLYATEDSYVVQGYTINDGALLAQLDLAEGETVVEVYARLLDFLTEDGVSGTSATWAPPIVHVRENGNLIIRGTRLEDTATRRRMALPDHEDAIVVTKAALQILFQGALCN
jgi:hypothetical protein